MTKTIMINSFVLLSAMLIPATVARGAEDVSQLSASLAGTDVDASLAAARELARLGTDAAAAVPALTAALHSDSEQLRQAAANALAAVGPQAADAVPALADLLGDADAGVRARAAYALGEIGTSDAKVLKKLVATSLDSDATVRRAVRDALRHIDAPQEVTLPIWIATLQDADPDVVLPAVQTLAELGKEAVPKLEQVLRDKDACYWACLVAAEIGPEAAELAPALTDILQHEHPECRMQALLALGEIGPQAKAAIPAVLELVAGEKFNNVRYAAAFALGELDNGPEVLEALRKLYQSDDQGLKVISAWSLLKAAPDQDKSELEKTIVEGLRAKEPRIRHIALRALREVEPDGDAVTDDLMETFVSVMKDASPDLQAEVLEALASKGEGAVPGLLKALGNTAARGFAVQVAMRMGPEAKDAVPALIDTFRSAQDAELKREIQFALGAIGPEASEAVPLLVESLQSDNAEIRYSACYALGQIGPQAKAAAPVLRDLARSDDRFMRLGSVWALLRILPEDSRLKEQAAPLLLEMIDDPREHIRAEVITRLGALGTTAKAALPAIEKALQDADPAVRSAAEEALKRLRAALSGQEE
jgi:HEAT repeat protein